MKPRLVIFRLPFSGRDEFLPLKGNPAFRTASMRPQDYRGGAQVIILAGSGRTVDDLMHLRAVGGANTIRRHLSQGGVVVGICAGYQMFGEHLLDPLQRQGSHPSVGGLGFLPIATGFGPKMLNATTTARTLIGAGTGSLVTGEEHRSGYSWQTNLGSGPAPVLNLHRVVDRHVNGDLPPPVELEPGSIWQPGGEEFDGLVTADRRIWGTY